VSEVLAVVPAKSTSKRLPNKNNLRLGEFSSTLSQMAVEHAVQAETVTRVLGTTDVEAIAGNMMYAGANEVVISFPPDLHGDNCSLFDCAEFCLRWLMENYASYKPDAVVIVPPPFPFRTAAHIDGAVRQFLADPERHTVATIHKDIHTPYRIFQRTESGALTQIAMPGYGATDSVQRGKLLDLFIMDALAYVVSPEALLNSTTNMPMAMPGRSTDSVRGYEVPAEDCMSIDYERDYLLAKFLWERRHAESLQPEPTKEKEPVIA
jgi:CMP-N-acetylneuraminic acid synthetase